MTTIIDGKKMADDLLSQVAEQVQTFKKQHDITPALAVILVGNDPASQVYVRNKIAKAHTSGIRSIEHRLSEDTTQAELESLIDNLNADAGVHGILVQLPLPRPLDEDIIINRIAAKKDVDGFHPDNVAALTIGSPKLVPCTPQGCMQMIAQTLGDDLSGKHAVIIGRSNIVGKPMAALLLQANCTITIVHSRTQNIAELCRQADIVVAAVGVPQLVKADWVKDGAVVIDVGINVVLSESKRKLVGDVDFAEVEKVVSAITPVPGGVGPMTIANLLKNTMTAANLQIDKVCE